MITIENFPSSDSETRPLKRSGIVDVNDLGPRTATVVIAASNSLNKTESDYVCSGTDDQITINAALASMTRSGEVRLLEGDYSISDTVNMPSMVSLIGCGYGTHLFVQAGSLIPGTSIIGNASENTKIRVRNLRVDGANLQGQNIVGRPVLSLSLVLMTVGILTAIGLAAGVFPARKAASVDPVESLRYE